MRRDSLSWASLARASAPVSDDPDVGAVQRTSSPDSTGAFNREALRTTRRHGRRVPTWRPRFARVRVASLLVACLVLSLSAIMWAELSGNDYHLQSPTRTTSHAVDPQRAPAKAARQAPARPGTSQGSAAARSVGTSARPSAISGTVVAIALIVGVNVVGLVILRSLRRRVRTNNRTTPETALGDMAATTRQSADEAPEAEGFSHPTDDGCVLTPATLEPGVSVPEPSAGTGTGDEILAPTRPLLAAEGRHDIEEVAPRAAEPSSVRSIVTGGVCDPVATARPASSGGGTRIDPLDKRLHKRVSFVGPARLQAPGYDLSCTTADLSMTGARCDVLGGVQLASLPASGARVRITLRLDDTLAVLDARIVWRRGDAGGSTALGLQFVQVPEAHVAALQHVVVAGTPM